MKFKYNYSYLLLLFVFALFAIIYLFYQSGLVYYARATYYISNLDGEDRQKASDEFFVNLPYVFRGTLAGFWGGKIWVWGNSILKSFEVDNNTVYSYTDGCKPEILNPEDLTKKLTINRDVMIDYASWKKLSSVGDYITIRIADGRGGTKEGNAREVYLSNFWPFMFKDMQTQCKK